MMRSGTGSAARPAASPRHARRRRSHGHPAGRGHPQMSCSWLTTSTTAGQTLKPPITRSNSGAAAAQLASTAAMSRSRNRATWAAVTSSAGGPVSLPARASSAIAARWAPRHPGRPRRAGRYRGAERGTVQPGDQPGDPLPRRPVQDGQVGPGPGAAHPGTVRPRPGPGSGEGGPGRAALAARPERCEGAARTAAGPARRRQARIFAFSRSNSSGEITPRSRRSASLVSWSAVVPASYRWRRPAGRNCASQRPAARPAPPRAHASSRHGRSGTPAPQPEE